MIIEEGEEEGRHPQQAGLSPESLDVSMPRFLG